MMVIKGRVRDFITHNFYVSDVERLPDNASLLEAGVIDSTGVLELVGFLEQTYGITVEDHELVPANLDSLQRLVAFVAMKLDGRETPIAG